MAGTDQLIGQLTDSAKTSDSRANDFFGQSQDILGPVNDYLKAILGGDQNALMEATKPERRRVIDQYAAAKKAIAEFTPRGGGQATAMLNLQGKQAGDLAGVTSGAKQNALGLATSLGSQYNATAAQQQGMAQNALGQALSGQTQQDATKAGNWQSLAQGAGMILGMILAG